LFPYKKHIGLFLLLVFTSTLGIESAAAAQNLHQLANYGDFEVDRSSYCEAGLVMAQDSHQNLISQSSHQNQSHPVFAHTGSENEKGKVIVINCSTSLQLISTQTISLNQPHLSSLANNTVILLASQLFVLKIADPPRLA